MFGEDFPLQLKKKIQVGSDPGPFEGFSQPKKGAIRLDPWSLLKISPLNNKKRSSKVREPYENFPFQVRSIKKLSGQVGLGPGGILKVFPTI